MVNFRFNTSTSPSTPSSTPEEDSLHSKRSRLEEKKTKKLKNQKQKSESRKMEDGQSREEDNRPNYFVACRISNPQVCIYTYFLSSLLFNLFRIEYRLLIN